jgi:hypothetical protein
MAIRILWPTEIALGECLGLDFEVPREGGWKLVSRVRTHGDYCVLTKLCAESDRDKDGLVPAGGITTTLLRGIDSRDILQEALDEIRKILDTNHPFGMFCVAQGFTKENLRPPTWGWRSLTPVVRAAQAALWSAAVRGHPSQRQAQEALSQTLHVGRSTIRGWEARCVPTFLTADGQLTDQARRLLEEDGRTPKEILLAARSN